MANSVPRETSPNISVGLPTEGDILTRRYDLVEQMQFLYVRLVRARDLPPCDPYVELRLGNYRGTTERFLQRTPSPIWNQVFAFEKDRIQDLNVLFEATIMVCGSLDPENQTAARGVAFAVNRKLVDAEKTVLRELVPGRAALLEIPWSNGRALRILNVYAPNDARANSAFWHELREATTATAGQISIS